MEHIGLGGNPGIGLTVPREPKQVLEETLYNAILVWDKGHQLSAAWLQVKMQSAGSPHQPDLRVTTPAIGRVTTPARPQSSVGLL